MVSVIEKEYMETVIRMGKRLQRNEIDWEQRRYEIANNMMAAVISNPEVAEGLAKGIAPGMELHTAIAKVSVTFAEALVAELKNNPVKE